MKQTARILLFGWLVLIGAGLHGGEWRLPPGTPVFSEPRHTAPLVTVFWEHSICDAGTPRTVLIKKHPLARHYTFVPVTLTTGQRGFVDPAVHVELRDDGPRLCFASARTWRQWLLFLAAAAAGPVLFWAHRKRRIPPGIAWGAYPVWLHLVLIASVTLGAENLVTSPMDENGYFANLQAVWRGDWTTKWHFTVGLSLLYVPFAALTRAVSVDDFLIGFSYFSALFLTPLRLYAAYLIGRKLLHSDRRSALAAGLWAVMPFLVHHYAGFADRIFYSYLAWPSLHFDFSHYVTLIGSGFNAMSDNPAAVLVLAVMVMVLYCRPAWPAALAAGAVFGFACMVRCNTILYAPVLLLAAGWDRAWGEWFRPRTIIAGIAGFLLGFGPQMAVNTWFFGAPWRFSYTDYAHGAHTYCAWIFGELNTAYYGAVNHWPWMLGILGLWLMRDNRLRLLLTAWFWPTVLLFLFYSHGTDDAVRFILPTYPAVFLAFAAILPESRDRRGWLLTAGLAAAVLLIPPNAVGGAWGDMFAGTMMRLMPTPGWIWLIALAAAVLLALAWKTGRRQLAVSGGMALVLQLWGNSFILVLLLAAAGVYSVIMFLRKRYTIGDDTL